VKTRLATSLGAAATLRLYRAFLTDLALRFALTHDCALHWAYTPDGDAFANELRQLVPDESVGTFFPQRGADFADRLYQVVRETSSRGFARTIIIGSDSPQISSALVSQARVALDEHDVVLGPAEDGGYYLIALREPHDLFTGIPMSTDRVLQMTMDRAQSMALSVHLLESLFDVDELSDCLRLARLLQNEPDMAPTTASCILQVVKELI